MNDPLFWRSVLTLAAPLSFYFGFRSWRLARLIDDTPMSRIRSAAQGYVELGGKTRLSEGQANLAPLSHRACAWWRYSIDKRTDDEHKWETINSATSIVPFAIEDETGTCLVGPTGADVRPGNSRTWYGDAAWPSAIGEGGGNYRYTEHLIFFDQYVSVIGEFRTLGGVADNDITSEVMKTLADWKQDQPTLLQRFDTNRDGILSQSEWEQARQAARAQIEQRAVHGVALRANIVVQPQDSRPFLVAACDLRKLARRNRWLAALLLVGFVAATTALAVLVFGRA